MAESQRERINRKNQTRVWRTLTPEARTYFLDGLRQARLTAQKDAERNVAFYAKLGIPEYFIYDRKRQRLEGHRLPPGGKRVYVPIVPQAGHYPSEALGLELVIEDGRLRFYARNAPLLGATEMIEHLRRLVEQVEASADERQHAEAEARRALEVEAEARRVEVEALRAEIERLKKG
jgi:hypothetical protein